MKRTTHVLFAVAISGLMGLWSVNEGPFLALISGLGGVIPDLDLGKYHRRLLHNLFIVVLVYLLLEYLTRYIDFGIPYIPQALVLGWLSHIFLDSFTVRGVALFYPFSNRYYELKKCRSNGFLCNLFFIIVSIAILVYLLRDQVIHYASFLQF